MEIADDLPENLQAGLGTLVYVPELIVGAEWTFNGGVWTVPCKLRGAATSVCVPPVSQWFLRVSEDYPRGLLKFQPAREGGIQVTFPHQAPNVPVKGQRYLSGDPCLIDPAAALGRGGGDPEPRDAYGRLAWNSRRLVEWVEDAALGRLLRPGDPFEHPAVRRGDRASAAFYEDSASYTNWQGHTTLSGEVVLGLHRDQPGTWYALEFRAAGSVIYAPPWGATVSQLSEKHEGIWLLVPEVPVVPPWGYPGTWGELRQALTAQGVDLDAWLRSRAEGWRDGQPRILLLGYPVPKAVGGPNDQVHWQACVIPPVSRRHQHLAGFRANEQGRWLRDKCKVLGDPLSVNWLQSRNQQPEELGSRGYLSQGLRELRYVLVGAGALGSAVAEHLVRTGVTDIIVLDPDTLASGNLVRHTLSMPQVGMGKAVALAARLNNLSPLVRAVGYADLFPPRDPAAVASVNDAHVLIDTTGSEDVIDALTQQGWPEPKVIVSLSLGWRAQSLYAHAERARRFNAEAFRAAIDPQVADDLRRTVAEAAPWEGVGCWAPVFPALHTDVHLLAATGVTFLREFITSSAARESRVYEQVHGDNGFEGLRRRS